MLGIFLTFFCGDPYGKSLPLYRTNWYKLWFCCLKLRFYGIFSSDFWMWIGIYIYIQWVSNCHFTVHVLYYFNFGGRDDYSCLVVELIQFWSNDSEDHKPSEPRINHNPQQGNPVASAGSSFLKDVLLPCSDWKSWMGRPLKDPS